VGMRGHIYVRCRSSRGRHEETATRRSAVTRVSSRQTETGPPPDTQTQAVPKREQFGQSKPVNPAAEARNGPWSEEGLQKPTQIPKHMPSQ